jgi:EAL domain-containing protein (putative c-di-GMP-specific phosphodiesterase class I)
VSERYGIIIGVNACGAHVRIPSLRFAEADAKAVYDHLTNENTGTFDAAFTRLLTGRSATTFAVRAALRDIALKMSPSDLLFVYFAGHAIISPWSRHNDPYLVTSDLDPACLEAEPDHGLRMSFLKRDVFDFSQGSSFLILDTCHAGAYLDFVREDNAHLSRMTMDALDETHGTRLSVNYGGLFACAADGAARESAEMRHGVLTHHVLLALQGGAANQAGEVTFDAVVDYVRRQEIVPEPGSAVQGWGHASALTYPREIKPAGAAVATIPPTHLVTMAEPLANPLDAHASSLNLLLDRFCGRENDRSNISNSDDREARLERMRHALDASAATEIDASSNQVVASVGSSGAKVLSSSLLDRIAKASREEAALGFAFMPLGDNGVQLLVVPPRNNSGSASTLVFADPAPSFLRIGEPIAVALQSLWAEFPIGDLPAAKVRTLSALRGKFGRLPLQIYQTCLDDYTKLLDSLVIVFEPIMVLSKDPGSVGIHGWEALARRDLSARRAPVDILKIADIWGDRFVVERDIALAVKAITSYRQAHPKGPFGHDSPRPVSINVSVRSLLSETYERALAQAISDMRLAPHMVTLEISERDAIEPFPDEGDWGPTPIAFFQNRLRELTSRLLVNFAVDDFGVGHASLDRISSLNLTQIKVDRAILYHSMAKEEIKLVVQLANEALKQGISASSRPVIVEGVESESPVSLHDLHELGINYVQGYITGRPAGPSLEPLSEEVRKEVSFRVRGM